MRNYLILKTHCKRIFLSGSGNFWYEENEIGDDTNWLYKLFSCILFFLYGVMTILEILAAMIGDFPDDEKSDSITFAVSHTIVMIKIFSVISNKKLIRKLNQNMVKVCEMYENSDLMRSKYKTIKINIAGNVFTVYGTAAFFMFEGLRKMHEGSHFVTVVTYYPTYEDNSYTATAFRLFTTTILMVMMISMVVTVDSFTMMYLIIYKYKFITLRNYFENLRKEFDEADETGNSDLATEKLTNGLVEGIVMHGNLLRIRKDIDKAFGLVMALQVCQTLGSAVSLLLQIALTDQLTFIAAMKIILFIIGLFFTLGLFLCNAGEITYQASLLTDSIFYCGWDACRLQPPPQRSARRLVLQACAQAQRPLVMKAFKMLQLTYGTFLSVARTTYSVFALIYAQKK